MSMLLNMMIHTKRIELHKRKIPHQTLRGARKMFEPPFQCDELNTGKELTQSKVRGIRERPVNPPKS